MSATWSPRAKLRTQCSGPVVGTSLDERSQEGRERKRTPVIRTVSALLRSPEATSTWECAEETLPMVGHDGQESMIRSGVLGGLPSSRLLGTTATMVPIVSKKPSI